MYFLKSVDVDDERKPIFYIDEKVTIPDENEALYIPVGKYRLTMEEGEIEKDGEKFIYNSYIDVPVK